MPYKAVELHIEASAEYDVAFDWYLQRSPESARKFGAEFDRALEQIAQATDRWAAGPHGTRRFLLRTFPFVLIYRETMAGSIQIVAVTHTSRKPGYWKKRT
jgi:plasmid stabilization system protein ParE